MRRLATLVLAIAAAGCRGGEAPVDDATIPADVTLAWNAKAGDTWTLTVHSVRRSEVRTGKEPVATVFNVTLSGELRAAAPRADGGVDCEFTFANLEGTLEALGVAVPFVEHATDAAGKKVAAVLTARGQLEWDQPALRGIVEGLDLNEDLVHLLPALPESFVAVGSAWKETVEHRVDAYELKAIGSVAGHVVARFAGTSRAGESKGFGSLTSSMRVEGTLSGEWDATTGALQEFRGLRTESARMVAKETVIETRDDVKRTVEVVKTSK